MMRPASIDGVSSVAGRRALIAARPTILVRGIAGVLDSLGYSVTHRASSSGFRLVVGPIDEVEPLGRGHPESTLVVVSEGGSSAEHRRALGNGASAVILPSYTTDELRAVIRCAELGIAVMPLDMAPSLVGLIEDPPKTALDEVDRLILEHAAVGERMTDIAAAADLSTRQVRRRIMSVAASLGVETMAQALVVAARCGLVSAVHPGESSAAGLPG